MSETKPTAYAAMITISLPGTDKTATASIVLAPEDSVQADGQTKRLRDCTLAELQTFANNWEAGVWETYEQINLAELDADADVSVAVTLVAESGDKTLADWADRAVVLQRDAETAVEPAVAPPSPPAAEAATSEEDEAAAAEPEPAAAADEEETTPPADAAETTPEAADAAPETAVDSTVLVSESEPVYAEEAERLEKTEHPPKLPPRPKVRIAGQRLPLSRSIWAAVDIFIEEPALRAAQGHALSSPSREVAGVLVGPQPEKQPDGRYNVYITDTIIAKHTVMQGASVTYTPESWRYMNDQLWQRYPDESAIMVGWYHTHPGFGIFLSGMDQFIHQNFFTQTWHVALVLDPIAKTGGFFCWDRQHTHVSRYEFPWPTWAAVW